MVENWLTAERVTPTFIVDDPVVGAATELLATTRVGRALTVSTTEVAL